MTSSKLFRIPQHSGSSQPIFSRWRLPGVTPHSDSQALILRLLDLVETQSAVESMIAGYASSVDGGVSSAFTEIFDRTLLLTATESLPSKKDLEADFRQSLYRDIGLVSRTFAAEIGLKTLLSLAGRQFPKRHRLRQLFDLLPPPVEDELERAYEIATSSRAVQQGLVLCPSARTVVELYDDLYTQLRYPSPEREEKAIASAWHNLGALLHASSLTVLSHELCRGMQFIPRNALQ